MPKVSLYKTDGTEAGTIDLKDEIFGVEVNEAVMHQVVVAQLANKRQGTQSALTRAEVRGGGIKPYRQKGTGRARAGTSRSPVWRGGGTIHGPQPRDYTMRVPKKVRRLALKMALSQKVIDQEFTVLDELRLEQIKTKDIAAILNQFQLQKTLVVIPQQDETIEKSARNIPNVKVLRSEGLNVYDLLNYHNVLLSKEAVGKIEETLGS